MGKKHNHLPTQSEIAEFLKNSEKNLGKREIARAFGIKGDDRIALKQMLNELKEQGTFTPKSGKKFWGGLLKPKTTAEITGTDSSGAFIARPIEYNDDDTAPQIIIPNSTHQITPAIKIGDMVLLKTRRLQSHRYEGEILKRLSYSANRIVGFYETKMIGAGGIISSIDKRLRNKFYVSKEYSQDAPNKSIVLAEVSSFRNQNTAKIIKVLGKADAPFAATIISAYQHSLPIIFPEKALKEADKLSLPPLDNTRSDLTNIPFVTIDGKDAKDFDDAIWAEPDNDKNNSGGWHLIVAIADIAFFVKEDSALDLSAKERGNSVYFPDRAIHMLPERLASQIASLFAGEERPAITVHLWINQQGELIKHKFTRAIIKSAARLNYDEVEELINNPTGSTFAHPEPVNKQVLTLYQAYQTLNLYREHRGCLNIQSNEKEIFLSEKGNVEKISSRQELTSYKLIEEFMITANIAAARTLEDAGIPVMYRIHEKPTAEKVSNLNNFLQSINLPDRIPAEPSLSDFNNILSANKNSPNFDTINEMILRSQCAARYSTEPIGHYGLNLKSYAHFTSPIRRYADLIIHRCLIKVLNLGTDGISDTSQLEQIADHITFTEKRADEAERDSEDRYIALYLNPKIGEIFTGIIKGVTEAGLFIEISEVKSDGFCPMRNLANEYFIFDSQKIALIGQNSGKTYKIGDETKIVLEEADPLTGSIILSIPNNNNRHHSRNLLPRFFQNKSKSKNHHPKPHSFFKKKHKQP